MAFCPVPSWLYRNYLEQVKCAHYRGQTIDLPVALELVEQFVKNTALQVVATTQRLAPHEFHGEEIGDLAIGHLTCTQYSAGVLNRPDNIFLGILKLPQDGRGVLSKQRRRQAVL